MFESLSVELSGGSGGLMISGLVFGWSGPSLSLGQGTLWCVLGQDTICLVCA